MAEEKVGGIIVKGREDLGQEGDAVGSWGSGWVSSSQPCLSSAGQDPHSLMGSLWKTVWLRGLPRPKKNIKKERMPVGVQWLHQMLSQNLPLPALWKLAQELGALSILPFTVGLKGKGPLGAPSAWKFI